MTEPKTIHAIARREAGVPGQAPEKKRYERPQIVYRAPLEAMATACIPDSHHGGFGKGQGENGCSLPMS